MSKKNNMAFPLEQSGKVKNIPGSGKGEVRGQVPTMIKPPPPPPKKK